MNAAQLINLIKNGQLDSTLSKLYGKTNLDSQKERYINAINGFCDYYGDSDNLQIFSAPGRTEIGGNHTDHNFGKVLAGSVNLDVIAVVSLNDSETIKVKSVGYDEDIMSISELAPVKEQEGTSVALIRGVVAKFIQLGHNVGGFNAYTTSSVLKGSGISSSAAFEVLIGTILSKSYNDSTIDSVEIAKISQFAEREYFGKPCGLMDQMASSVGGIISIDFQDTNDPIINTVEYDFDASGYALCIVDTGGNHADLTCEYAAIPNEMKLIANYFEKQVLRDVSRDEIFSNMKILREKFGDRAVLRALHYLDDNARVDAQVKALRNNDFEAFKSLIIESGNSSFKYLQNVYTSINVKEQGLSLALYIAEKLLQGKGAYRVHGGGFGGTTQNFVPIDMLDEFKKAIENAFGEGSCHILTIRPVGGTQII